MHKPSAAGIPNPNRIGAKSVKPKGSVHISEYRLINLLHDASSLHVKSKMENGKKKTIEFSEILASEFQLTKIPVAPGYQSLRVSAESLSFLDPHRFFALAWPSLGARYRAMEEWK